MNAFDATQFLKELPHVLSWKDSLYLVHYLQQQESEKVNVRVHMNLISLVVQGRKDIYHHSGKTGITAGSGFFIKKGAYLMSERQAAPKQGYEALTILFTDEWFLSVADEVLGKQTLHTTAQTIDPIAVLEQDALLAGLTAQLSAYFGSGADKERLNALLPVKIMELLQILLSAPGGKALRQQLQSMQTLPHPDLMLLMEGHFRENISLEQYAFLSNNSLSTFKRKFSEAFHMPPGKWIRQRRLEEAYALLGKTAMNITELAYEIGFESPAHFISAFKEQYHITPKQLQQQLAVHAL